MRNDLKTIISFTTSKFPIPLQATGETCGRDLADFFGREFALRGAILDSDSPIEGEEGWSFWLTIDKQRLRFFLNVAGLNEPIRDYWVISYHRSERGILGLLKRSIDAESFALVARITDELVNGRLDAGESHWWTDGEFSRALLGK